MSYGSDSFRAKKAGGVCHRRLLPDEGFGQSRLGSGALTSLPLPFSLNASRPELLVRLPTRQPGVYDSSTTRLAARVLGEGMCSVA